MHSYVHAHCLTTWFDDEYEYVWLDSMFLMLQYNPLMLSYLCYCLNMMYECLQALDVI